MSIIKNLVINIYYVIYLTLEQWLNPLCIILFLIAGVWGFRSAVKGNKSIDWKKILVGLALLLYIGINVWTYAGSLSEPGIIGSLLQAVYYIGMCVMFYGIGNVICQKTTGVKSQGIIQENEFWKKLKCGLLILYFGGWIPLGLIAPYIFPKADDYSFGYHAHRAWEQTNSIWEVIKAAFVMIEEAWYDWQGTYSSIFFMAIQPAVFDEKLYAVVPFLFMGIITVVSYFLMKTILCDWLQTDKVLSRICIWSYLLLVIQRIPDSQSAFIWYNGATHYIAAHCALLCAIAFTIKGTFVATDTSQSFIKRNGTWIFAAIFSIYVGGGNYVTAVGALLICLTVLVVIGFTKSWKKYKNIVGICVVYFAAMAVNFIAPGNFTRKGRFEGYNIVTAFVMAFVESLEHMLGKWMHWTIIVFILFMIPVLWRLVSKMNFHFKYPGIVIGYSWCYMASLFFAPLYTLGEVNVGRFQNAMFLEWILLLFVDLAYVIGWFQRKCCIEVENGLTVSAVRGIKSILGVALLCFVLSMMAEPQKYTSVYAFHTFKDPGLKTYAEEYWEMVGILNSDEKVVEVQDFSYIPPFFDVSLRHEGLKLFYSKEEVRIK